MSASVPVCDDAAAAAALDGRGRGIDSDALLEAVVRFRYVVMALLATGLVGLLYGRVPNDWGFVQSGVHHLFSSAPDGGLRLYAGHAELQMGPLTFAVARVADAIAGVHSLFLLTLVGTAMLLPTLRFAELAALRLRRGETVPPVTLLGAFTITTALWVQMPLFGHLDDCLVLLPLAAAAWAVASERLLLSSVLVGVACVGKPWGLVGVPLLFVPIVGRSRSRALCVVAAVIALVYGPFVVADVHTLGAGRPTLLVDRLSTLQLLGIPEGSHPWGGLRAVQLALSVALGAVAVVRHRPQAVLVVAVAARLLLDPGSNPYFPAGLAVAALVYDMSSERRLPFTSLLALVIWMSWFAPLPDMAGTVVRMLALVATVGIVLGTSGKSRFRLLREFAPTGAKGCVDSKTADAS